MGEDGVQRICRQAWQRLEAEGPGATRMRRLRVEDFAWLQRLIASADAAALEALIADVYAGDVFVWRDAFDSERLGQVPARVWAFGRGQPAAYRRIADDCPDFHYRADTDLDETSGYSSKYNTFNFFRWNGDALGLFALGEPAYRAQKLLSGLSVESYRDHRPADGIVDKLEVLHYPRGVGGIDMHGDPAASVKITMGVNLTQPGTDYRRGGFVAMDGEGRVLALEAEAPLGAIVSFYPPVWHGVDVVDPQGPASWDDPGGRWFMGLTSVQSHMVENRAFTVPGRGHPTLASQKAAALAAAG